MTETPSHPLYRLFQKIALAVGGVATFAGFVIPNSAVSAAGIIILVHALTATIIIAFEDRRKASRRPE